MDRVESAISLTDQAREWVGDKLVKVGSFVKPQRAQSNDGISSPRPVRQQDRYRRASETAAYDQKFYYYNRLNEYSAKACGGLRFNEKRESADINEEKVGHDQSRSECLEIFKKTNPAQSFSIAISLSPTEQNNCIRETTKSNSGVLKTELCRQISATNGIKCCSLDILQPIPRVCNVHLDFEETFEQHTCTSGMCEICRENGKMPLRQTSTKKEDPGKISVHKIKETKTEAGETFSNRTFSEKRSNSQNTISPTSRNTCSEKLQSSSCSTETNEAKDKMKICKLSGLCKPKVKGTITLGLQHFKKSRQFRIILLSVESFVKHKKNMYCKVKLTGNSSPQKQTTRILRSNTGNADFKETFYMDLEKDDMKEHVLKIQLRTVSRLLQRHSTVGVVYLALENVDLTFYTTMAVKLRDPKQSRQVSNEEDVEIISDTDC